MRRFPRTPGVLLLLCVLLAPPVKAEDRPADKILAEINAIEMPMSPQNRADRAAVRDYALKSRTAMGQKATLIGELYRSHPDQPELAALLPFRWEVLCFRPESAETVKTEIAETVARSKDEKLVQEAFYYKMLTSLDSAGPKAGFEDMMPFVDEFARKYPGDARIPRLLLAVVNSVSDPDAKEVIFKRLEADYSTSPVGRRLASLRARAEADHARLAKIGKPFELEFTEATKGTPITMASLKGKVVVVDFWATWCGPCIAEMPKMKKLYAEYKDKGVEFIGVSLDQPKEKGGLDRLKDYVARNGIEWPQYYQGNYWQSEFSSSWAIHAIPCVFLIDADGNLATVEARGKLETLIPEYLEKARAGPSKTVSAP